MERIATDITLAGKLRPVMFEFWLLTKKISSFSERDLLMRYHWGLEIGHIHAHKTTHETTDPQTVEGSEN